MGDNRPDAVEDFHDLVVVYVLLVVRTPPGRSLHVGWLHLDVALLLRGFLDGGVAGSVE